MAATESQLMTNIIASPVVMNPVHSRHARQRVDIARFATAAADAANHIYRLTKLKAHDVVTSIRIQNGADAGMTDLNIGIWTPSDTTADPVVIDADGLVDGFDASGAQAALLEILGTGANAGDAGDLGKALWEFCPGGPATEPDANTLYEICVESIGNPAGTPDYAFIIEYTAGD